jgi:hypothetical protein
VLGEVVEAYLFGRLAELEEFEAKVRRVTRRRCGVAARYFDEVAAGGGDRAGRGSVLTTRTRYDDRTGLAYSHRMSAALRRERLESRATGSSSSASKH